MINFIYFIIYLFIFIFGICIGSFLNVVIYRTPKGISIAKGRSYCPKCNNQLKNYDLVPIFSYLVLKGKCRFCSNKISIRYPIVELFTGIIFIICFMCFGFNLEAVIASGVSCILITISLIDFDTMEIPNGLIIALIPFIIISLFVFDINIISRLIGFFVISLPMYVLTLFIKDSFGGGDIKLIAVCGFLLGFKCTLLAMFIAILLGGTLGIYLMVSKKANKGSHIPFGPYICVGVFISFLYGNNIIDWYLKLFNLA